jgi:hypothetical protein
VLQTVCHKLQEDSGTGGFLASELPFHGWKRPEIAWGRDVNSIGLMDELQGFWSTFSKPNTEFNRATLTLRHCYITPTTATWHNSHRFPLHNRAHCSQSTNFSNGPRTLCISIVLLCAFPSFQICYMLKNY